MKILLTGFNAFGGLETNPSQIIVEAIEAKVQPGGQIQVATAILPTEFQRAGNQIQGLILREEPVAVVCLGVAQSRSGIHLERWARNLNDCSRPDNTGATASPLVVEDGPPCYESTLPLERMRQALQVCGIPVQISDNAGTYVCNHVFYLARHFLEQQRSDTRCGFIHMPFIAGEGQQRRMAESGLPLVTLMEGIDCCLRVLREDLLGPRISSGPRGRPAV